MTCGSLAADFCARLCQSQRLFVFGRGAVLIRCPSCGNVLARYSAGCWIVTRRGREWISREVLSIRCERCETVWQVAYSDSIPILERSDHDMEIESKAQKGG